MNADWIGWLATATFTSSYFFRSLFRIRAIQAVAACLWLSYGIVIGATPMIFANILVIAAALFTMWRDRRLN